MITFFVTNREQARWAQRVVKFLMRRSVHRYQIVRSPEAFAVDA